MVGDLLKISRIKYCARELGFFEPGLGSDEEIQKSETIYGGVPEQWLAVYQQLCLFQKVL